MSYLLDKLKKDYGNGDINPNIPDKEFEDLLNVKLQALIIKNNIHYGEFMSPTKMSQRKLMEYEEDFDEAYYEVENAEQKARLIEQKLMDKELLEFENYMFRS